MNRPPPSPARAFAAIRNQPVRWLPPALTFAVVLFLSGPSIDACLLLTAWLLHLHWLRTPPAPTSVATPVPGPAAKSPTTNTPRHHALVVDDHPINLVLARDLLEALNVAVTTAQDGPEALRLARRRCFDIVFLDVQMPGMDGMEVCRRLHTIWGAQCPPVIALTAHAFPHEREQFLAAGMDECLTKPVSGSHLASSLGRWLPSPRAGTLPMRKITTRRETLARPRAIDREACVRLAGGKPELARQLVRALVETLPESLASIQVAARQQDRGAMRRHLHRLLGACQYAGVPALLAESRRLHNCCVRQPLSPGDPAMAHDLYDEGLRVLREGYAWLAGTAPVSSTTKASA